MCSSRSDTLPHTRRVGVVRNGHTVTTRNDGAVRHRGQKNGLTKEGSAGVEEPHDGGGEPHTSGAKRTRQHSYDTTLALFQVYRAGNTRVHRTPWGTIVELVGGECTEWGATDGQTVDSTRSKDRGHTTAVDSARSKYRGHTTTIQSKALHVARHIVDGLHDPKGREVHM